MSVGIKTTKYLTKFGSTTSIEPSQMDPQNSINLNDLN